jgi:hypothetical protein
LQCGAVLALDARWGEGKTWFVRHWAKHLDDTNHNVIYLDAFANDYLDDPFLVVTSEITDILNKDRKTKSKVKKLIELSASVGSALLPSLPKVALTLGLHLVGAGLLSGALQQCYENTKDEIDALSDEASERIKESIQNKIANHEAEKNTLSDFKKHLTETVEKLDKPLVFIIDELDRCRPDFAIRLIERIKHFFDIPKIVFILVMNKKQFITGIGHTYGYESTDSIIYLDKFIDFEIPLISNTSVLSNTQQAYDIVEKSFIAVGENSSDIHFIFHQGVSENLNNRELKRKINIYALLKTNSLEKNLFLALMIASGKRDILNILSAIYVKVMKLEGGNQNLSRVPEEHYNIEKFKLLVKENYKIELNVVVNYYSEIKKLMSSKMQYHIHNYPEKRAEFLSKYALSPVYNIDDQVFSSQYLNYLKTNFDINT